MSKPAWTINTDQAKQKKATIPTYDIGQLVQIVDGLENPALTDTYGVITNLDRAGRPVLAVQCKGEATVVKGANVLWKRITQEEMALALLWGKTT